jgi:predicted nucleic acid-binding protein
MARAADVTVYDAIFVALAESLEATFVTADQWLAQRLAAWPFVRFRGDLQSHS